MPFNRLRCVCWLGSSLVAVLLSGLPAAAQQGFVLSAVGPINGSMGGASTAAPIDASGALHWNPASIAGLARSEVEVGVEMAYPVARLSSAFAANSFGPGLPPVPLADSTRSNSGVAPLPTIGFVYRPEGSCWTFGVGFFTVGGFTSNYPGSFTNPILTAPPPNGFGVGPIYANLQVWQVAPTAAWQVTDRLAVGFSPTVDLAYLVVNPDTFAPPDDANGDGFATYPPALQTRIHWGMGFQVGAYYTLSESWHLGASLKSPQWFEPFQYNSQNELRQPRTVKSHVDYPMIVSIGAGWTPIDRLLVAADVRWLDFAHINGFHAAGFAANGAITELGWRSIVAVALGAQYLLSDRCSLRLGYTYNSEPIPDANTSFNLPDPTITQHRVSCGTSWKVTDALSISLSYVHVFEHSISGPLIVPAGPVPGTSLTSKVSADAVAFGATVQF
jgi:long-chain fatty acid transport protein